MARLAGSIEVAVGPSAKDFWPKFRAQTKNAPTLRVKVDPDLSRLRREIAAERRRQEANHIKIKTDLDRRSAERTRMSIQRIVHTWRQSDFSRAIRVNLMVAGAASMPSLIQGLMSLTTAVTELGRAALVLPGVFTGIGAAAGTAATGILGVADAFKELDNGFDNTAQKMRLFQQSSRDLEQAQRGIVDAIKEANRAIEDQQTKLTRNQLSVEQAQLNLQKANAKLAKGGFDSVMDWRQAVIDQKQAQLDLNDTIRQSKRDIQDYYDSSRKGATQSATFKDALDRLATAMENYEKRQIEASGVTEKFLQALEKLSPAARDFVVQVRGLSDAWGKLQNVVQERLFANLGDDIVNLTKTRLPMLQKGMEQVAKGLNTNVRQIISSIGSDQNSDAISKIFERTGTALERMNPGLNSLVNAFLKLSEVGSRFLPRLSGAFNDLSKRFENFIDKTEADGSLKSWIDGGLRTVSALGRSLQSVLSIFGSITEAYQKATGNIQGFAGTMDRGLAGLARRLSSPEGQRAMIRWIGDAREFIDSIKQSLPGIRKIFQSIADGARTFAEVAFPVFAKIGEYLERFSYLVEPLIAFWAIQRTAAPFTSTLGNAYRSAADGLRKYRDAVEAAKVSQQNFIDTKKSLNAQIESDQRTRAKEQIYYQSTLTRNKLDKQQAADALDGAKRNLAQLKDQHRLQVESLRANQRMLGQITDLSRAGGMQFREDGRPGVRTRIPVSFEERLAQIREMANREAAAIRDMEQRLLNGRGLPQGGVRRTQMEERLRIARVNLEAYTTALSGATSLEQMREDAWVRLDQEYKKVEKSQQRVADGERTVSQAVRNAEAVKINSLDREIDARGRLEDTDKRLKTNQAALISLDREATNQKGRLITKIDQAVAGHTRLNRAWDTAKTKAGGLRSAIGLKSGGGVTGALGALVGAMGKVVTAVGTVGSLGLLFALDALAQAHQKAGDRAKYQRDMENALASSLDQTTGAVTAEGVNEQIRRGQKFEITGGGNKTITIDAIESANKAGIPTELLKRSLDPRQIEANNQVQKTLDDQTLAAVRAGKDDQWNKHGENLRKFGVTDEIYAKALNGDQDAVRKFEKAKESIRKDNNLLSPNGPVPGWLNSINGSIQERLGQLPDLGAAAEQLTRAGVSSVGASQFQRSSERANATAGTDVKAANDRATIKPGSPFPGAENAFWDPDGKGVGFVMNNLSPEQRKYLEETVGADVTPSGSPGSYIIHITGDLVDQWVEPRPYARGGSVWGAGTATSDSIPALLSNGEYVINAKSASLIGHDTLNQMNGITNRGKMTGIPRFAPGGEVDPNDWIDLIGDASDAAAAEKAKNIPGQRLEVGTGQIPGSADQRPGEFDRGEFTSAGQAQAARRGRGPVGDPNPRNIPLITSIADAGRAIWENFTMTPEKGSDRAAELGIPKAKPYTGEPFLPVWRDILGVPAPGTKPAIPFDGPLYGPHTGSGQPGPGGQRSTTGFPVAGTPGSLYPPRKTPATPAAPPPPVRPGEIPTYEQLPGGPAPATPTTPGAPPYTPLTPGELTDPGLTNPVPLGGGPVAGTPATPSSTPGAVPPAPEGLVKSVLDFARIADGFNYEWGALRAPGTNGPNDPGAVDCSSLVLAIARAATGKDPFAGGRGGFNTANQGDVLAGMGFLAGPGGPGDLVVGWTDRDGDGPEGHTGITLPDGTPIDAQNPGAGVVVGEGSGGAGGFDNVMHLPMSGVPTANIPTVGDISTAVPPPGAVRPGGGGGSGGIADGLPKLTGPYGDLPDQPVDILRSIGEILLSAVLGFFGVNPDSILSIIRSIFGDKKGEEGEGDPGVVPEENPDPNIDPGPDQKVIDDLVRAAGEAKARGDELTAKNLLQRARDYRQSRLMSSAPPSTLGSLTLDSTPDVVAKAILSEARARGYSKEEAHAILSTAISEKGGNLNPRALTPNGNWLEIFQNPKNPVIAGNPDPNLNIQSFFDRLGEKTVGGIDIWTAILWAQQRPDAPNPDEAIKTADPQYLARIQAGSDAARTYMEQLGYAKGGVVRRFRNGGFAAAGPLDIFGDPWDPWPSLDEMYGTGEPGHAFLWPLGVMSGQDPIKNAQGGHIRGPGTATSDSIPALLSDGEYVIRASAVKQIGKDRLDQLNSIGRFSGGGLVGSDRDDALDPLAPYLLPDGTPRPKGYKPALPDATSNPIDWVSDSLSSSGAYISDIAKGVAPLIGAGGEGAPGVAESWQAAASAVGPLLGISNAGPGGGGSWGDNPADVTPIADTKGAWAQAGLDAIHYEDYASGRLAEGFGKTFVDIAGAGVAKLIGSAIKTAGKGIRNAGKGAAAGAVETPPAPKPEPPKAIAPPPQPQAIAPPPSASSGVNWRTSSGLLTGINPRDISSEIPISLPGLSSDVQDAIVQIVGGMAGLSDRRIITGVNSAPFTDLAAKLGDPRISGAYGFADNITNELYFNSELFSNPDLLIEKVLGDSRVNWTTRDLSPEDAIFNIVAHEFIHPFARRAGVDPAVLFDSFFRGYQELFPDLPIEQNPENFAKFLEGILPSYSYKDRRELKAGEKPNKFPFFEELAPDGPLGWGMLFGNAIRNIDPIESFPNAVTDVLINGMRAQYGSKLLYLLLGQTGLGRNMPSIPLLSAINAATPSKPISGGAGPTAISPRITPARMGPLNNRPLTPGQALKEEISSQSISGALGGDLDVPNKLNRETYKKNNPKGGRGWFTPGGKKDVAKMVENLLARFNDTTGDKAWIRDAGMRWYDDARAYLVNLLEESGQNWTLDQAAAALAALSGNTGWNDNMLAANQFFKDTTSLLDNRPGVIAARRAIASDDPISVLGDGADKWKNFAAAILGIPYNGKAPVAVDRWATRAALGTDDKDFAEAVRTSTGGYDKIAEAYRIAAEIAGVTPEQMQAITWMHIIKPPEMAMWDDIAKFRSTGKWDWAPDRESVSPSVPAPGPFSAEIGKSISPIFGGMAGTRWRSEMPPLESSLINTALRMSPRDAAIYARQLFPFNKEFGPYTPDEIEALIDYSEGGFLSGFLRDIYGKPGLARSTYLMPPAQYISQLLDMDSAMDASPRLPDPLIVSRVTGMSVFDGIAPGELPDILGQTFTDPGYMSTSMGTGPYSTPWSNLIRHELYLPPGTRGAYIGATDGPLKGPWMRDEDPELNDQQPGRYYDKYNPDAISSYPYQNEYVLDRGSQLTPFEVIFNKNYKGASPMHTRAMPPMAVVRSLIDQPDQSPSIEDQLKLVFGDRLGWEGLGTYLSGFASGGYISGPGGPTSDRIPALLSDGEYVIRAAAVKHWGVDRLNAINSLRGFNLGGLAALTNWLEPKMSPPVQPPAPAQPPVGPKPPGGPAAAPAAPKPPEPDLSNVPDLGKEIGASVAGAALAPKGGGGGVSASAPAPKAIDPRAVLGAAPTSSEHTNPALKAGIKGAFSTIGSLAGTAAQAAIIGGSMGTAAAAGPAAGAASSLISAGAQLAGDVAAGAVNVLSALGVGTVTPSQTGQGYGAPLLPAQQTQPRTTNYQSIHNGNIVTNNLSEYSRLKDRKDAQKSAPFFNRVNS